MTASLHATRFGARLSRPSAAGKGGAGRLWRIGAEGLVFAGATPLPGDVVAVPAEEVLVVTLDLPLPSRRQRIKALPFAIEDRLADPPDAVHLALGVETGPRRYLAGAVRHDAMRRWLAAAEATGLARSALVPDALLLPRPAEGVWRVDTRGGRAAVRSGDGTGFALPAALLVSAWLSAGRPACVASGDPPPAAMRDAAILADADERPERTPPLDLAQGRHAPRRRVVLSAVARRVLTVAAAGTLAHAAIATADTIVLRRMARDREAQARMLAAAILPGIGPEDDLIGIAAARLPDRAAGRTDRLLPLLDRVSAALGASGRVDVLSLSYDDARGMLAMAVPAGSEDRLAGALAAAGLVAGKAPGRVIVRSGG